MHLMLPFMPAILLGPSNIRAATGNVVGAWKCMPARVFNTWFYLQVALVRTRWLIQLYQYKEHQKFCSYQIKSLLTTSRSPHAGRNAEYLPFHINGSLFFCQSDTGNRSKHKPSLA